MVTNATQQTITNERIKTEFPPKGKQPTCINTFFNF